MRLSTISLLAFASSVFAAEVKIEITKAVECERKTQKGDKIHVHYRGNLEENGKVGKEFDASYNRGSPLSFVVGKGSVIKGYVLLGVISYSMLKYMGSANELLDGMTTSWICALVKREPLLFLPSLATVIELWAQFLLRVH